MSAAAALLSLFRVPFATKAKRLCRFDGLSRTRAEPGQPAVRVFAPRAGDLPTRSVFARLSLPEGCRVVQAAALRQEAMVREAA